MRLDREVDSTRDHGCTEIKKKSGTHLKSADSV